MVTDFGLRGLSDIRTALEKAGVEFIAENGGGAGVRLRKPKAAKSIPIDKLNASNDD